MRLRNPLHQCKPDSAAALGVAGPAIEAIEYSLPLRLGDAGTIVENFQPHDLSLARTAHGYAATLACIAECVVEQVPHENAELIHVAANETGLRVERDELPFLSGHHLEIARHHIDDTGQLD